MKIKNFLSILVIIFFGIMFWESSTPQHLTGSTNVKNYANSERISSRDTILNYKIPVFHLVDNTMQTQIKGGVTISCEISPVQISEMSKSEKIVFYRNMDKPDFDIYQMKNVPFVNYNPRNIVFNITIKNNQGHVLKLRECALAVLMNNIQYSFPDRSVREEWENSLVMSGFSFFKDIKGPSIEELKDPKSIEVFINDVPTEFDDAGNVKKRENFDWLFSCSLEEKTEKTSIKYTYEEVPIEKKQCVACSGRGVFNEIKLCSTCNGNGSYKGYDGKIYKCPNCNGSGKVNSRVTCQTCRGEGAISINKSPEPPLLSQVTWSGPYVNVITVPLGLTIERIHPILKEYVVAGKSPLNNVLCLSSFQQEYPLIIIYNNQPYKIYPKDRNGKTLYKVKVDFSNGTPNVIYGTLENSTGSSVPKVITKNSNDDVYR